MFIKDSCRACGKCLTPTSACIICKEYISWICNKCNSVEDAIHSKYRWQITSTLWINANCIRILKTLWHTALPHLRFNSHRPDFSDIFALMPSIEASSLLNLVCFNYIIRNTRTEFFTNNLKGIICGTADCIYLHV